MTLLEQIKMCRLRKKEEIFVIAGLAKQARLALQKEKTSRIEVRNGGRKYFILKTSRGPEIYSRPIRYDLYIQDENELKLATNEMAKGGNSKSLLNNITRASYTFVQDIAAYLDIFESGGSKKTLGTFFESQISVLINMVTGLEAKSGSIKLPGLEEKVSWDLSVKGKTHPFLFVATKTSTRERLSQPFVQKLILSKALKKPIRAILVVIGDVQRVKKKQIQHTFTAGQFVLYSRFVERLDGVYYMDMPPQADKIAKDGLLMPFKNLLNDLPAFIS